MKEAEVDDDEMIKYKDKDGEPKQMKAGSAKTMDKEHPAKIEYDRMADKGGEEEPKSKGLGKGDFKRDFDDDEPFNQYACSDFDGDNCDDCSLGYFDTENDCIDNEESNTIVINVDGTGDYENIQTGIDAAAEGDTVLVQANEYTGEGNRNISFGGKNIVLMSEKGNFQGQKIHITTKD